MSEYYIAVSILVACYIFGSPLLIVSIVNEPYGDFKSDYCAAFVVVHCAVIILAAIFGAVYAVLWAVNIVAG